MDVILEQLDLLGTTRVLKFEKRREAKQVTLDFQLQLLDLTCHYRKGEKDIVDTCMNISEIKEIRSGLSSNQLFGSASRDACCLTIVYGQDFVLKQLPIEFDHVDVANSWKEHLQNLVSCSEQLSYHVRMDAWLLKEYTLATSKDKIGIRQACRVLKGMGVNVKRKEFLETLKVPDVEHRKARKMSVSGRDVIRVAKEVIHSSKVFTTVFTGFIRDSKLFKPDFHEFLKEVQMEACPSDLEKYEYLFGKEGQIENGIPYLTASQVENFLFSDENELCKPECSALYQDMTRPLSHYWIASSHNTYLTGDQFKSESSPEAYARCLQQGCRCIELDCWNGPDGSPQIYHGYTMTSKISLVDVLQTIKKYAFVKSAYPVILSIENHCNVRQQKVMAQMLMETFQSQLVSHPCKDNETELPSPEELKYKFLVKCKGPENGNMDGYVDSLINTEERNEEAVRFSCLQTRKRGVVFCKNSRNDSWEPYKCILTSEKLILRKISRELSGSATSLKMYSDRQSTSSRNRGMGGRASKSTTGLQVTGTVLRQQSFTEEYSPKNFADFELTSSRFSGNIPDMSAGLCLDLEFSVNCAEIERNSGHSDLQHLVRIENGQTLIYAALEKIDEANEWKHAINEVTKTRPRLSENPYSDGRRHIAEELAKLAVYARTTKYRIQHATERGKARTFNEMHSFPEKMAVKTMASNPGQFIMYHQVQFSRVYPTATRLNSTNYDPTPLWNVGCQMVALNYQTPDKPLQLNHGKFGDNGGCGYILKPDYLLLETFNPNKILDYIRLGNEKLNFTITVIAARHLECDRRRGATNPFVDIDLFGAKFDKDNFDRTKHRTKCSKKNRLNPFWNETFSFRVCAPELALIRFSVQKERCIGDSVFMGQATYPVLNLRPGVRSINLRNGFGESLMAVLLIKCEIRKCKLI